MITFPLPPFAVANVLRVSDVNCGPLSDTIWSGSPMQENRERRVLAVSSAVGSFLYHKNLRPLPMGISHYHDHLSLSWSYEVDVKSLPGKSTVLSLMQFWSLSMFGHQTSPWDKPFILTIPI